MPTADEKRIEEAKRIRLEMDQGGCSKIIGNLLIIAISVVFIMGGYK